VQRCAFLTASVQISSYCICSNDRVVNKHHAELFHTAEHYTKVFVKAVGNEGAEHFMIPCQQQDVVH
jgi:hypothetical protein